MALSTEWIWRYDVRLSIQPSEDISEAFREEAISWLQELKNVDESIRVFPYLASNVDKDVIHDPSNLPTRYTNFKQYFHDLRLQEKGGYQYFKILLGHTKPYEDINEDLQYWMRMKKHGFWKRQLTTESPKLVTALMYSTRNMDVEAYKKWFYKTFKIPIGMKWRRITDERAQDLLPDNKSAFAVHIETDSEFARSVSYVLGKIYNSKQTKFPLGIRMRLIPANEFLYDDSSKLRATKAAIKQFHFTENIKFVKTDAILDLDTVDNKSGKSLRDAIMNIPEEYGSKKPLFHSIDTVWKSNALALQYIPKNAKRANMIGRGLVSYLIAEEEDEWFQPYVNPHAFQIAKNVKWNKKKQRLVSAQDKQMMDALEADDDYDFADDEIKAHIEALETSADNYGASGYETDETCATQKKDSASTSDSDLSDSEESLQGKQTEVDSKESENAEDMDGSSDDESVKSSASSVSFNQKIRIRKYTAGQRSGTPRRIRKPISPGKPILKNAGESNNLDLTSEDSEVSSLINGLPTNFSELLLHNKDEAVQLLKMMKKPPTSSNQDEDSSDGDQSKETTSERTGNNSKGQARRPYKPNAAESTNADPDPGVGVE